MTRKQKNVSRTARTPKRFSLFFLCMLLFSGFSAISAVQKTGGKIKISEKQISLSDLFWKIQSQTQYEFLFDDEDLQQFQELDVNVEGEVEEVLTNILKGKGLTFQKKGKVFVIKKRAIQQQKVNYKIKGKVTDEAGDPLPGVTVKIEGTYSGTATNINGEFVFSSPKKTGILIVSFVGKKSQKIAFTAGEAITVKLVDDMSQIEEVSVVAYGNRNTKELVTSISSIKAEELEDVPVPSLAGLLQGRVAGLNVTSQSGSPGGGGDVVNIRGHNTVVTGDFQDTDGSPLYVIDGVPMKASHSDITGTSALAEINPANIESVEILKDAASAALYGSRAANGVILITTKKGRSGESTLSATYSTSYTYNPIYPEQLGGHGERRHRLAVARNTNRARYGWPVSTYYESYKDSYGMYGGAYDENWNGGRRYNRTDPELQDSLNRYYNNSTNWFKKMFRVGKVHNAQVQTSGGTEKFQFMLGGGYYSETGISIGSAFKRADGIISLQAKPRKGVRLNSRVLLSYTDRSVGTSNQGGFGSRSVIEGLTSDPTRTSTLHPSGGAVEEAILKHLNGGIAKVDSYRINANLGLEIDIYKGLSFNTRMGWDFSQNNSNEFSPADLNYRKFSRTRGQIGRSQNLSTESLLKYKASINQTHNFDALLGFSIDRTTVNNISGQAENGPSDDVHYASGAWPETHTTDPDTDWAYTEALQKYQSTFREKALVGVFGRLNYNYKKKYLINATLRKDGSSTFGEKSRWGYFPSVALGWAFTKEPFMDGAYWLDFAKIRASWGKTGRPFNSEYLAHGVLIPKKPFYGHPSVDSGDVNYKLEWEKADQYDFGIDLDFLDYRLKTKIDYYYRRTYDILNRVTPPTTVTGITSQWANAMALSNQGFEIELEADIIRKTDLKWRMKFNLSRVWNRFEESYNNRDIQGNILGRAMNQVMVYKDAGFYTKPEDLQYIYTVDGRKKLVSADRGSYPSKIGLTKILDLNGDGEIDPDDRVSAGSALPKFSGGLLNNVKYKNWSLSMLISYTVGRKMYNSITYNTLMDPVIFANPKDYTHFDEAGVNADLPALGRFSGFSGQYATDVLSNVENVSYARLKSLTLSYDLSKKLTQKLKVEGIRFYATGENLFMLHNYSGMDPETVDLASGIGRFTYPLSRRITLGVNLKF